MPTYGGARRAARASFGRVNKLPLSGNVTPDPSQELPRAAACNGLAELRLARRRWFWLIQPLTIGTSRLGGQFGLMEMPAAEFEGSAQAESLRRMRAAGGCTILPVVVTLPVAPSPKYARSSVTRLVYLIGPQEGLKEKAAAFAEWVSRGCDTFMTSLFEDVFLGRHSIFYRLNPEYYDTLVAWWSISGDVFFALDKYVAKSIHNEIVR